MAEIDVDASLSPSQLDLLMADALRPAILLNKTARPGDSGAPGCWLGAEPALPPEIEWHWFVSKGQKLAPMHFVAQISLAALPREGGFPPLSTQGSLFFFTPNLADIYGVPDESAKVIDATEDVSAQPARNMPSFPAFSTLPAYEDWAFVYRETPRTGYTRWPVDFLLFDSSEAGLYRNSDFWSHAMEANVDVHEWLEDITASRRVTCCDCWRCAQTGILDFRLGTQAGWSSGSNVRTCCLNSSTKPTR